MKSLALLAMAAVILSVGLAMAADNSAGLAGYRVIGDTSVSLAEAIDLFIPSLSGGTKFLPPKANGLGLIHRWNPQLADATWKTRLQPGDMLRLPQEWVLRGIQGVLEAVETPQAQNWNPSPMTGAHAWLAAVVIALIVGFGGLWIFRWLGWI